MNTKKHCLSCGEIVLGRSDKKFCNTYCRNGYNNQTKREEEGFILRINKILRKNRRILKTLNPIGKTTIRKEVLKHAEYDFRYFTNVFKTSNGNYYYFCYDFGFCNFSSQKVTLVNWQDYMKSKKSHC